MRHLAGLGLAAILFLAPVWAGAQAPDERFVARIGPLLQLFHGAQQTVSALMESDNLMVVNHGTDAHGADLERLERLQADALAAHAAMQERHAQIMAEDTGGLRPEDAQKVTRLADQIAAMLAVIPEHVADQRAMLEAMLAGDAVATEQLARRNLDRRVTVTEGLQLFMEIQLAGMNPGSFMRPLVRTDIAFLTCDLAMLNQEIAHFRDTGMADAEYAGMHAGCIEAASRHADDAAQAIERLEPILTGSDAGPVAAKMLALLRAAVDLRREYLGILRRSAELTWTDEGSYIDADLTETSMLDQEILRVNTAISENGAAISAAGARLAAGER